MRIKLLFGNWKMNKTQAEAGAFAKESVELLKLAKKVGVEIGVAPTFLSLQTVKEGNPELTVAAQNCNDIDHGAFTGEISIPMLSEIGINWCIIGHSERRTYNGETSHTCNLKLKALVANEFVPIYCCGETLAQFEANETKSVINSQIREGFEGISGEDAKNIVIAYEPIWSIGTGKNASKEIAEDICHYIRTIIADLYGKDVSEKVRILYGGSVKPENVHDYLKEEDVDGALVGGASLKVESFKQLIENAL